MMTYWQMGYADGCEGAKPEYQHPEYINGWRAGRWDESEQVMPLRPLA